MPTGVVANYVPTRPRRIPCPALLATPCHIPDNLAVRTYYINKEKPSRKKAPQA